MVVPARDDNQKKRETEHLPLSSELVVKINHGPVTHQPGVLKAKHVSILKRLAKSVPDIDLHVQIRNGRVCRIRHTIEDYTDITTEDNTSLEEE